MKDKDNTKTHLSQLFKHRNSDHESDHEGLDTDIYGDKVDDEDEEMDEEENEEDGKEEEAGEEEDVDKEAEKRYMEAKVKEGVHQVCIRVMISEAVENINKLSNSHSRRKKVRPQEIYGPSSSMTLASLMVW